jgi:hypothetical protein
MLQVVSHDGIPPQIFPDAIFITWAGVCQLIRHSKMPNAKKFNDFVDLHILPQIIEKGEFNIKHLSKQTENAIVQKKSLEKNQIIVINEYDVQQQFVNYVKTFYPKINLMPSLGETCGTFGKEMGYQKGFPDLFICCANECYNGFFIEFKHPSGNGILSLEQKQKHDSLRLSGFKVLLTDNLFEAIFEINEYMKTLRIECLLCKDHKMKLEKTNLRKSKRIHFKFKTDQKLLNHQIAIHKIKA